eukprot:SAG11_NODE_15008_length_591_cov_2.016260_1_plen_76_part_10
MAGAHDHMRRLLHYLGYFTVELAACLQVYFPDHRLFDLHKMATPLRPPVYPSASPLCRFLCREETLAEVLEGDFSG